MNLILRLLRQLSIERAQQLGTTEVTPLAGESQDCHALHPARSASDTGR